MANTIYTIGHSTRTLDEFQTLLKHFHIEMLVDVRTVPKSRHVPHFNSDSLPQALERVGVEYRHLKGLGGLRKPIRDSVNLAWRNLSFRGFADYMQTEQFQAAVAELMNIAAQKRAALMCAEAVPWRCHRSLIADMLIVRGWDVRHILSLTSSKPHQLNPIALAKGTWLTYPQR